MVISKINVSELDSTQGFVITGEGSIESISNAGDVNGDGFDDVLIGTPYFLDINNQIYVVFGGSDVGTSGDVERSELDGSDGFVIRGLFDSNSFSINSIGDINGDGFDDIMFNNFVIFGRSDGFDGNFDLQRLFEDNGDGFIVAEASPYYGVGGGSVHQAGDINGDGIDDILLGSPGAGTYPIKNGTGAAYVVFGSDDDFAGRLDLADLEKDRFITFGGTSITNILSEFGYSTSNAGDINGDGIDDIIVSAPYAGDSFYVPFGYGYDNRGEVFVIFGSSNTENIINNRDDNFIIRGEPYDRLGFSVNNAGDINGDGFDDVIIDNYVIFGSDNVTGTTLQISQVDGNNGFAIANTNGSISGAGDVNGDGIDDLIIGNYVIFGNRDGFTANLNLENLDDSDGIVLVGTDIENNSFELNLVSGAGDINGDGVDDIIASEFGGKESYIIFGRSDGFTTLGQNLIGTREDDLLTGDLGNDTISGLKGDDTLSGDGGRDEILGGRGNDLLSGGENDDNLRGQRGDDNLFGDGGNDTIGGGAGRDFILGAEGNDSIAGNRGNDLLFGGNGNDSITGNQGNDLIFGEAGNDSLLGGRGNDFIQGSSGVDLDELDTLTGGEGNDTFVLGNTNGVFYDDGDNSTAGNSNLAVITDFDGDRDTIQLKGSAEIYSLDFSTSDAGTTDARLIYNPEGSTVGEIIAVLENVNFNLSLEDSAFTFVSK